MSPRRRKSDPPVVGPAVDAVAKRPTETLTGLALAGAIYGFLTQDGVSATVAALAAVAIAFVPGAISAVVDKLRRP